MMPNVQKCGCNVYIFQLSFHFAHHRWWLGMSSDAREKEEEEEEADVSWLQKKKKENISTE